MVLISMQETLDALPKAIRSSISHYLFYSLMDKVYLFRGVSNDLLFQLVSEMKAEYFPPKEDIILQNEAPTDFYILVTGAVVKSLVSCSNFWLFRFRIYDILLKLNFVSQSITDVLYCSPGSSDSKKWSRTGKLHCSNTSLIDQ
ncbi:potassium channel AKT1 isoform X2 [Gossypium australe]|uniref:Potassium channel AKT1 isoform X2 n=1 Tax=Gossypium australe TaxID=47621 RepID=A0A5B6W6T4_9ROSI|nr:potassium channel AKT1 isoform X2 [Gossypium australe]